MMSLWDALRMNMMISYQELVRTFHRLVIYFCGIELLMIQSETNPQCSQPSRKKRDTSSGCWDNSISF